MLDTQFPAGTPVRVRQVIERREGDLEAVTFGVVEAWQTSPTGSWLADGRDGKLWLQRLRLRKADGEITLLVIDDLTFIARAEEPSRDIGE